MEPIERDFLNFVLNIGFLYPQKLVICKLIGRDQVKRWG